MIINAKPMLNLSPSDNIWTGALVQWLKLPAWKVGDRGFKPHSGLQFSKAKGFSHQLTRKDSILWGASVTEMYLWMSDESNVEVYTEILQCCKV